MNHEIHVVDLKAVTRFDQIHRAQVISYLHATFVNFVVNPRHVS